MCVCVCVCVCVSPPRRQPGTRPLCVCARASVCVCVCARARAAWSLVKSRFLRVGGGTELSGEPGPTGRRATRVLNQRLQRLGSSLAADQCGQECMRLLGLGTLALTRIEACGAVRPGEHAHPLRPLP